MRLHPEIEAFPSALSPFASSPKRQHAWSEKASAATKKKAAAKKATKKAAKKEPAGG